MYLTDSNQEQLVDQLIQGIVPDFVVEPETINLLFLGKRPIEYLIEHEHEEAIITLIEKQVSFDAIYPQGFCLIHLLAERNLPLAIRRLLSLAPKYADLEVQTGIFKGWTPVHFAVANNHLMALKTLTSYEASLSKKTWDGFSPIHIALYFGSYRLIDYLLIDRELEQEVQENYYFEGFYPIHIAAFTNHVDMIVHRCSPHMLTKPIARGAFLSFTPLQLAMRAQAEDSIILLKQREKI